MTRKKRNVDDVAYVETAEQAERPMREVLRERAKQSRTASRAEREAAYRKRAGIIGALGLCLCSYPIVLTETVTQHEEWCPAHHLLHTIPAASEKR